MQVIYFYYVFRAVHLFFQEEGCNCQEIPTESFHQLSALEVILCACVVHTAAVFCVMAMNRVNQRIELQNFGNVKVTFSECMGH